MKGSKVTHTRHHPPVTMASVWHIIAGHLSVRPSVCPSNQITHEALQQSHNFFKCFSVASHTHAHTHEWLPGRVSAHMVTLHIKLWRLLWFCDFAHCDGGVSVCEWKVKTHTRSLCCRVDIKPIFQPEVRVKSVLFCESWRREAGSPLPLLNLGVRTFSRTMASREQTLPVCRALFCAVRLWEAAALHCAEGEWQSAWQKASSDAV